MRRASRTGHRAGVVSLIAAVASLSPGADLQGAGQGMSRSVKEGVYTTAQADRGKVLYDGKCASCHGSMASVTPDMAPLLNDHSFQSTWRDRSVGDFFTRIRDTMPQDKPRSLTPTETAEIIAHILRANQMAPGERDLDEDVEILNEIRLDAGLP